MLAQQQTSNAREPKSHFTLATQPEKESEVSDVKASRNIGHSEGHSHRGQRRLCTRRHASGHPDLDLGQPYPVGREADWRCCETRLRVRRAKIETADFECTQPSLW